MASRATSVEVEAHPAQHVVTLAAAPLAVRDVLVRELEDELPSWEDREAGRLDLLLAGAGGGIQVRAAEAARLQILVGVPVEGNQLPLRAEGLAEREMVGALPGHPIHGAADVVGGIGVVVGAEVLVVAEEVSHVLGTELETGLGHAIAELGVDHGQARLLQGEPGVGVRAARRRVRRIVDARASRKPWNERRSIADAHSGGQDIAQLPKVADGRLGKGERILAAEPRGVAFGEGGHGVAVRAGVYAIAEIFERGADLHLVVQIVDDLPVHAHGRLEPGGGHETVGQSGPVDAVEEGGLVVEVGVPDGYEVYARRPHVEVGIDPEINPRLLDAYRAVLFVVLVAGDAAMLELDLGIEKDAVREGVARHQDDPGHVGAELPLAVVVRILDLSELELTVHA